MKDDKKLIIDMDFQDLFKDEVPEDVKKSLKKLSIFELLELIRFLKSQKPSDRIIGCDEL